jgi:hypothetical protein
VFLTPVRPVNNYWDGNYWNNNFTNANDIYSVYLMAKFKADVEHPGARRAGRAL